MIVQEDVPYTKEEVKAMVNTIHDLREKLSLLGWHPASELPKEGEEVMVVQTGSITAYRAVFIDGVYYSVIIGKKAYYPSVKWWCYPPKED